MNAKIDSRIVNINPDYGSLNLFNGKWKHNKIKAVKAQARLDYDLPNLVIKIWNVIFHNTFVTSLSIKKHLHETKVILRSRKSNFLLLWTFNSDIIRPTIQYVYTTHREKFIQFIDEKSLRSIILNLSLYTSTTYKHRSENLLRFYSPSQYSFCVQTSQGIKKPICVIPSPIIHYTICVSLFSAMNRTVYTSTNFVKV